MQAEKYLGEEWLFPTNKVTIKPPRIPFFEEEEEESGDDASNDEDEPEEVVSSNSKVGIVVWVLSVLGF
jgi:hypothetical protein